MNVYFFPSAKIGKKQTWYSLKGKIIFILFNFLNREKC